MVSRPDSSNDFSGEAETVVQAGVVHGGIHLHRAQHVFTAPRQLPLSPSGFVNREADLLKLDRFLVARPGSREQGRTPVGVSTVSGPPGVGKTAMAVYWAHRVRSEFPDGDLYIDMQGFGPGPPLSTETVLEAFLRALDVRPDNIPEGLTGRAALFRSLLDGKRVLLLIDNATSSAQVRHLIPGSRQCFTLVTSRNTLSGLVVREGALPVTLDVLSSEESVLLLSELMGHDRIAAEVESAQQVAQLCGHLPLALRVVAERAVNRPQLSLADLVDELNGEQRRLDALASAEDELSDTRAVFSWSYQALTPDLMRTFRLIGLHEGADIGLGAAAALIGANVGEATRQLRALVGVHLLQETTVNRFQLHALLRSYSRERALAEEAQAERMQAVRRSLTWYLLTADRARSVLLPFFPSIPLVPPGHLDLADEFVNGPQAMSWFDTERRNLLAAMRQATEFGQFDIGWKLPFVTTGFFELRSYWDEWESNHRSGLAAAELLGDSFGEAVNMQMLGDVAWRRSRFDEAISNYRHAAEIGRHLSAGWIEGFALRGEGLVREQQGDFHAASEMFRSALQIFRSDGLRRGEGMSLLSLGKCAHALNDPTQAVAFGTAAVRIFEEIDDVWTLAWGRLALAISLMAGEADLDAMAQLRRACETFRLFDDHHSEAEALVLLAELYVRSDDVTNAQTCRRRAAELYEILGDSRAAEVRARIEDMEAGA
ncbi:ATP-binding protein [Nonomuraea glycinis]|uniref:ATP-binding protein n=1 Tax=Nonomuraea glycinis TaxID=2047744 RepID=UPI002E0E1D04|nr:tetratricopeptide repeat protein [Nonomuraea glycinis]